MEFIPVHKETGGKAPPAEVGVDYCNRLFRLELSSLSAERRVKSYVMDYKNEPDGIEDMMPWSDFIRENCSKVEYAEKDVRPKQ
ncbi:MAG: hypothetical protein ACTTK0_09345 [Stomatobaculum sp.]